MHPSNVISAHVQFNRVPELQKLSVNLGDLVMVRDAVQDLPAFSVHSLYHISVSYVHPL